jgi:hypothetical protein
LEWNVISISTTPANNALGDNRSLKMENAFDRSQVFIMEGSVRTAPVQIAAQAGIVSPGVAVDAGVVCSITNQSSSRRSNCHGHVKATGVAPTQSRSGSTTRIVEEFSTYPMRLMCQGNQVCVLGFGGGSVSGDIANLKVELADQAFLV